MTALLDDALRFHKRTNESMMLGEPDQWPASWKKVEYNLPATSGRLTLPKPTELLESLSSVLLRRESRYPKGGAFSLEELGQLLFWSAGLKSHFEDGAPEDRRVYPSAGFRYSTELLVFCSETSGLGLGAYRYEPKSHSLAPVAADSNLIARTMAGAGVFAPFDAPFVVFIAADLKKMLGKYKLRGYRFAMLEAGAVLQNIYLVATQLGMSAIAIGAEFDNDIEKALYFGEGEVLLSTVWVGA